jgi:hypothetical protein
MFIAKKYEHFLCVAIFNFPKATFPEKTVLNSLKILKIQNKVFPNFG